MNCHLIYFKFNQISIFIKFNLNQYYKLFYDIKHFYNLFQPSFILNFNSKLKTTNYNGNDYNSLIFYFINFQNLSYYYFLY